MKDRYTVGQVLFADNKLEFADFIFANPGSPASFFNHVRAYSKITIDMEEE